MSPFLPLNAPRMVSGVAVWAIAADEKYTTHMIATLDTHVFTKAGMLTAVSTPMMSVTKGWCEIDEDKKLVRWPISTPR